MADYTWWLNLSDSNLHSQLDTTLVVSNLRFYQGDNPLIEFSRKQPAPGANAGFDPVAFPTGGSLRIGIVNPDQPLTGGTFTLTFGGDTTTALAYDISAEDLATAINALASITSAGGVSVTGTAAGPWKIKFTSVGARDTLTANVALLEPLGEAQIYPEVEGDASTQEVQYLRIKQAALAEQGTWSDISASTVGISTLQAGSGSANEIQRIALSPYPRGGTFTLTWSGQTTAPIAFDATAATLQAALEALSNIATGDVSVTKQASGIWLVEFTGTKALADQAEFTASSAGLLSYEGKTGRLSLQRPAVQNYLDANADENGVATAWLEIEIQDATGNPTTKRYACEIVNDGLGETTSSSSQESWKSLTYFVRNLHLVTSLTGGTATDLDAYGSDLPVGTIAIIGAVTGLSIPTVLWILKTSQSRPSESTTVVHVDAHAEHYWESLGGSAIQFE